MEGLIEEGSEVTEEDFKDSTLDAALIGAAQRVEHYEIAAYGTARAFAETLGETEHVSLLAATLEEEKDADRKLTELASQINQQAYAADEDIEEKSQEVGERKTGTHKMRPRRVA
jgi:ferritin-like metal-binding protein YciE